MLLDGAKEAYELSFVAVPAQPRAGTHKSIGFRKPVAKTEEENIADKSAEETNERITNARVRFFMSRIKGEDYE